MIERAREWWCELMKDIYYKIYTSAQYAAHPNVCVFLSIELIYDNNEYAVEVIYLFIPSRAVKNCFSLFPSDLESICLLIGSAQ